MDANGAFTDLGIDPIEGTELMGLLNIYPDDLSNPTKFNQLLDVVDYVKAVPVSARGNLIRRVTVGKHVDDVLAHVWGYTQLRKEAEHLEQTLKTKRQELSYYEE